MTKDRDLAADLAKVGDGFDALVGAINLELEMQEGDIIPVSREIMTNFRDVAVWMKNIFNQLGEALSSPDEA